MKGRGGKMTGFKISCFIFIVFFASAGMAANAEEKRYNLEVASGLGYDNNPFLAPSTSYFDPFLNSVVVPERQSGFFVPYEIEADYTFLLDGPKMNTFFNLRGESYLKNAFENANFSRVQLGAELGLVLREKGRFKDRLFIKPSIVQNREIYFDRDTGLSKTTTTTLQSLADRFKYTRWGVDSRLRIRTTHVKFTVRGSARKYNYEEVPLVSSLDYSYYRIGGDAEYAIHKQISVKVAGNYYTRDFDTRPSRDLRGDLVPATTRKYNYYNPGAALTLQPIDNWDFGLSYDLLLRRDDHVRYNDYTQHEVSLGASYRDNRDRRIKIEVSYWNRDYPRTFAFDDPRFPLRKDDRWSARVTGEMPIYKRFRLWVEANLLTQVTADPRYDYSRAQVMAGLKFNL